MIELGMANRAAAALLGAESTEVLVRSAMEGSMGRVWVYVTEHPSFCLVSVGRFSYLLGLPPRGAASIDLYNTLCTECADSNRTVEHERWGLWLEKQFRGRFRTLTRYALNVPEQGFDSGILQKYISELPEGFALRRFDEALYRQALSAEWSADFVASFANEQQYRQFGMGFAVMQGERMVSACSAYAFSMGMMEVEVATERSFRRRGLASAAAARFLLDCMEHGLRPNWDAANLASVGLAEKLGYKLLREYQIYQISVD